MSGASDLQAALGALVRCHGLSVACHLALERALLGEGRGAVAWLGEALSALDVRPPGPASEGHALSPEPSPSARGSALAETQEWLDASTLRVAAGPDALAAPPAWGGEEPPGERIEASPWPVPPRFEDGGPLGAGGMGEVRRVRDRDLNRVAALKALRAPLAEDPEAVARFVTEAQITAHLGHPGIVPIHEAGTLPDGRPYFTMRVVRGQTLGEVIRQVHGVAAEGAWGVTDSGWSFSRLEDAFRQVCDAVGFAHRRGVVHRDLKPANILVGRFGEVMVVDWGLAVRVGEGAEGQGRWRGGTPAYLPPERLTGDPPPDPRQDVYSLGAILYEIISGRPPYVGPDTGAILAQLRAGPPPPPARGGAAAAVPAALIEICLAAMHRDPGQRPADGVALVDALAAWRGGVLRRERALRRLEEADGLAASLGALRAEAAALRAEAEVLRARLRPLTPAEEKAPLWALEDGAAALDLRAAEAEAEQIRSLRLAIADDPDYEEAEARLADLFFAQHRAAEAAGEPDRALALERQLAAHGRGRFDAYLLGEGRLTLMTEPPGAQVTWQRFERVERRLVAEPAGDLGPTPLVDVALPMGRHLLTLSAPGRVTVRYPLRIDRQGAWTGALPGASSPAPVWLPPEGALGPEDVYIPAGPFLSGGDAEAFNSSPRRELWLDGYVLRRFMLTQGEYLTFINGLVMAGREAEAIAHAPRAVTAGSGQAGAVLYGRGGDGLFTLTSAGDVRPLRPEEPVTHVDFFGAVAYTRWLAEGTGLPWRLPAHAELEKAARGADGRLYPWGDFHDPTWACTMDSHPGEPRVPLVDSFPVDTSVYGVRGLAGSVSGWCLDAWERTPPPAGGRVDVRMIELENPEVIRPIFGSSWDSANRHARAAGRAAVTPRVLTGFIGFRLARSLPAEG